MTHWLAVFCELTITSIVAAPLQSVTFVSVTWYDWYSWTYHSSVPVTGGSDCCTHPVPAGTTLETRP